MTRPYRRLFRGLTQADVEQVGRDRFYRDEARLERLENEHADRRDEREAREIRDMEDES